MDTTHEAATLTVEVRVDLLLKGGLVEVAGADGDTHGDSLLLGLASDVLEDSEGGVDATALTEEGSDGAARALGSAEDNVNVVGDVNLGLVLEDRGETVREVEGLSSQCFVSVELDTERRLAPVGLGLGLGLPYLALNELGLNGRPSLRLGGITKEVHNNGTTGDSLIDLEEVLAGNPAILNGILPGLTVLSDTNDDVEAVVTEVETLAVALRAIADERQSVVLEVLLNDALAF